MNLDDRETLALVCLLDCPPGWYDPSTLARALDLRLEGVAGRTISGGLLRDLADRGFLQRRDQRDADGVVIDVVLLVDATALARRLPSLARSPRPPLGRYWHDFCKPWAAYVADKTERTRP